VRTEERLARRRLPEMAESDEGDKKEPDARLVWLRARVCGVLRCKEEKVDRLLANEDSAAALSAFLDGAELNRLLVYETGKGELAAVREERPRGREGGPAPRPRVLTTARPAPAARPAARARPPSRASLRTSAHVRGA